MKKVRIILLILLGTLLIPNLIVVSSTNLEKQGIHPILGIITERNPVTISLDKRIVKSAEKLTLTINITNFSDQTIEYVYKIYGENFSFTNKEGSFFYHNLTGDVSVNPDQTGKISVGVEYKIDPETEDLISSVQVFLIEIIEAETTEVIYSNTEWVWIYSDYDEMVKPEIPNTKYPLYNDKTLLISYSLHYRVNTSSGYIRFNINNLADNTQEYRIYISNKSQFLRFDKSYIDDGYECSLICSGKGNFDANFSYILPKGSVWTLIPITIGFQLDGKKLIEEEVVVEIQPLVDSELNIIKKSGDFVINENGTVRISTSKDDLPTSDIYMVLFSNITNQRELIYPEINDMNDQLELIISEQELAPSYLIFIYGKTTPAFYTIAQMQLFSASLPVSTSEQSQAANISFIGIQMILFAGLILVLIKKGIRIREGIN
ncbi:MAG: hypothetical protein ACFFDC_19750 [Promethearchaeota archaeon]